MAIRVLLVLVAFALLSGCARESTPAESKGITPTQEPDQGSQDERLEAYLDRMTTLLLDEGLDGASGSGEKVDREVRVLAETRTLSTLQALDAAHKRQVLLFLVDASLVQGAPGEEPVLRLTGADLRGVDLTYSTPGDTRPNASAPVPDLSSADLTYADLRGANLSGIVMVNTRLVGADLRDANLTGTPLNDANLSGANLTNATGKTAEQLDGQAASLYGPSCQTARGTRTGSKTSRMAHHVSVAGRSGSGSLTTSKRRGFFAFRGPGGQVAVP